MTSTSTFIKGPVGQIEAVIEMPSETPVALGVVCHPHPQHGGTMTNKVVTTVARAWRECHAVTIRFNYRGVGQSEGAFANALGETQDALAVIDAMQKQFPTLPLWLAGFSFGAYVAYSAARQRDIKKLITIAPVVDRYDFDALGYPTCPWTVVQGGDDEIVDAEKVKAWHDTLAEKPKWVCFDETGHFFHGKLIELREAVKAAA